MSHARTIIEDDVDKMRAGIEQEYERIAARDASLDVVTCEIASLETEPYPDLHQREEIQHLWELWRAILAERPLDSVQKEWLDDLIRSEAETAR